LTGSCVRLNLVVSNILAHPTSAIVGKPGVPDYVSAFRLDVNWKEVFEIEPLRRVALESELLSVEVGFAVASAPEGH